MPWAAIERGRRPTAASLAAATRDAARVSYALAQCFRAVRRDYHAYARRRATARRGIGDRRRRHRQVFRAYVGAQAQARNAKAIGSGRVELRHGSVSSLPFADNTFHKAMAVNSMQIWPDAIAGLREMGRVMKSGATIALGFTPYSGQKKEGLIDKLVAAGFTKPRVVGKSGNFCALATKP